MFGLWASVAERGGKQEQEWENSCGLKEGSPGGSQLCGPAVGLERGQWGLFVAVVPLYEAENGECNLMGQEG
jgi:hypothetical protein